jgi:AraC-like DNA-binding protein
MPFEFEHEMGPSIRLWLEKQNLLVKQEFLLPWGVCDFVGLSFNSRNVQKRIKLRQLQPIGPLHRLQLLSRIPEQESGRTISDRRLRREFQQCAPDFVFETELRNLLAGHFVVRTKRGSFQKLNGWAPLHRRLVAVELKLSRISEAITQAACHLGFATESYVALPAQLANKLTSSSRVRQFKEKGIGILAVTEKGCRLSLRPSGTDIRPDFNLQMHCTERFWRTRDSSA